MARRGRKRRLDAESRYWQMILSGVGTVEACREVGIGRKTAPVAAVCAVPVRYARWVRPRMLT
jgi:hypothetical protein